jgi:hypothetical protein
MRKKRVMPIRHAGLVDKDIDETLDATRGEPTLPLSNLAYHVRTDALHSEQFPRARAICVGCTFGFGQG